MKISWHFTDYDRILCATVRFGPYSQCVRWIGRRYGKRFSPRKTLKRHIQARKLFSKWIIANTMRGGAKLALMKLRSASLRRTATA